MSETDALPGPGPSGLTDSDLSTMIKNAADAHYSKPTSTTPALPPGAASTSIDDFLHQLNKMPLFMTELDETGADDNSPNDALDAIKALQYEGSDLDVAKNFKNQGNDCFKAKGYKEARVYYSKGLAVSFEDKELKESLLGNRAQCNLLLGNYGKAIVDCRSMLAIDATKEKAWFRAAKALLQLDKLEEAKMCVENAWILKPENREIQELAKKIEERTKYLAKMETERVAREKKAKEQGYMLSIALQAREISVRKTKDQQNSLAGEWKVRFEQEGNLETQLLFPTMMVYHTPGVDYTQLITTKSDLIAGWPETVRVEEEIREVLAHKQQWDERGVYRPGNVEAYMETKTGGLVKVGQKVSLLAALSNPKVEVVDGLVVLYVVAKNCTEDFIKTWKKQKMRQ